MAYKILKSMIEIGYEPDVRTWNVILHGLCQQNAMRRCHASRRDDECNE